jgi:glutamate dehydrogenase (NAD(P)+)
MDDVFRIVDELGPAKIVARGPSVGGLRMAPDVSTAECVRLARAMTLKNAAAGLVHGGGKSVLYGDPRMPRDRKERLLRAFAHAVRHETVTLPRRGSPLRVRRPTPREGSRPATRRARRRRRTPAA